MTEKKRGSPNTTAFTLRGRQSVRATFKLSKRAIQSLSLAALHLGIKQKSLFDHLIEDTADIGNVTDYINTRQFNEMIRVQKTFVLSRKTLDILSLISKNYHTPRDAIVEYSIQRLESVIHAEQQRHEKRKDLFEEISAHWREGEKLLTKSRHILGPGDPFCTNIEKTVQACAKAKAELVLFIEKSRMIESY